MNICIKMHKILHKVLFVISIILITSCDNKEYINAVPSTVTALVKIDMPKIGDNKVFQSVASFLQVENFRDCGIDVTGELFLFETSEGNLGLCAKVDDSDKLLSVLNKLSKTGKTGRVFTQGKCSYTDINSSWAVGFSDKTLLILGPVSSAALPEEQRHLAKLLKQDEDAGVVNHPIYTKLDSMDNAISMVAQIQAMPEKFIAPFTVGMPKDADPSQIYMAAKINKHNGIIKFEGETFSFDKSFDSAIKKANSVYRNIKGNYVACMPQDYSFGLFANIDGKEFLPLLQKSKPLQTLLVGLNTAIDFDNIIKSVNGDFALMSSRLSTENLNMTMLATVERNPSWLSDVNYWKQSCPQGSSLTGTLPSWNYKSGNTDLKFGIYGNQFYATTDKMLLPAERGKVKSIDKDIEKLIIGNRMVLLLNIKSIIDAKSLPSGVMELLSPLLDGTSTVVYVMK